MFLSLFFTPLQDCMQQLACETRALHRTIVITRYFYQVTPFVSDVIKL